MNISIIGASKGIGLEAVKRALEKGHHVTALSRSEIEVIDQQLLTKIEGDATEVEDVQKVIEGTDAILVCLGTKPGAKNYHVCTDFTKVLLQLNAEAKIEVPVIIVSAFGAGDSSAYSGFVLKLLINLFLSKAYKDKNQMEQLIFKSNLNWIVLRPGRLIDKELTEKYHTANNLYKGIDPGSIHRSDVADYMIAQAEQPTELGKFVTIMPGDKKVLI